MALCIAIPPHLWSTVKRITTAVSLVVLLAAVGAQTSALASTKPNLPSMLLTVSQMPTGWSIDNTPGSGIGCLSRSLEAAGIKETGDAEVTFAYNASIPEFQEKLATYAVSASRVFPKIVATLDACKTVAGTASGQKVTGTVGAMSFPHYGAQSAAWAVSLTIGGAVIGEDILVVREGTALAGFAEADYGSANLTQFQGFVRKALAKIG